MLTLYHYPLCPKSRSIRVLLREFDIKFGLEMVDFLKNPEILKNLNPGEDLPVIQDTTNRFFYDFFAIIGYLIDLQPNHQLIPSSIEDRAEMRRLISWIMIKFDNDVTNYILSEKLYKILSDKGSPRGEVLRAAKINCNYHFEYFSNLISSRGNICLENLTLADIVLASQISVLDYMNDIIWDNFSVIKQWYSIIKSRPSFRPLLGDRMYFLSPPKNYDNLDF